MKRITLEDLKNAKPVKPNLLWLKNLLSTMIYSIILYAISVFSMILLTSSEITITNIILMCVMMIPLFVVIILLLLSNPHLVPKTRLFNLKSYNDQLVEYNKLNIEYDEQQSFLDLCEKYKDLE